MAKTKDLDPAAASGDLGMTDPAAAPAASDAGEKEAAAKEAAAKAAAKRKTVTLRHKTQYPVYRRAGIVLGAQPKEYVVTAEQLAALTADAWVEVIEK